MEKTIVKLYEAKERLEEAIALLTQKPTTPYSSYYHWVLDPGHGGFLNGKYYTNGKFWNHKQGNFHFGGTIFYEGVFNRIIVSLIAQRLSEKGITYTVTAPSHVDVSLDERVAIANRITDKPPFFLSIHSNAFEKDLNKSGSLLITSPGVTKSDKAATIFWQKLKASKYATPMLTELSDGDPDYEMRLYVLMKTKCPSVLAELGYFTNFNDALINMDPVMQNEAASALVEGILEIEKTKL